MTCPTCHSPLKTRRHGACPRCNRRKAREQEASGYRKGGYGCREPVPGQAERVEAYRLIVEAKRRIFE